MPAVRRSRCLISHSAAAQQQPGNSPAVRRGRPAALPREMKLLSARERSPLSASPRILLLPSPRRPPRLVQQLLAPFRPVPTASPWHPSQFTPPHRMEGETQGEKGWEPNNDPILPAWVPTGCGAAFRARRWVAGGSLALSMSSPTLFHRELDTRVRAIAHRLKQSVVQDNSINCERKSIARLGLRGASRARGNQTAAPAPTSQRRRSRRGRKGRWRENQRLERPPQRRGRGMAEPGFLHSLLHPRPSPGVKRREGEDVNDVGNEGEPGGGPKLCFWWQSVGETAAAGFSGERAPRFWAAGLGQIPAEPMLSVGTSRSWPLAPLSISAHWLRPATSRLGLSTSLLSPACPLSLQTRFPYQTPGNARRSSGFTPPSSAHPCIRLRLPGASPAIPPPNVLVMLFPWFLGFACG